MFLHPHVIVSRNEEGVLYKAILHFLEPVGKASPFIYPVLAFLLLLLQAIALTRFQNNQRMMSRTTYFPGMAYLLITSLFPEWNYFSAPLIVNTILLYVLSVLFNTYNQQNAKAAIFNIGLDLALPLFYSSLPSLLLSGYYLPWP